MLLVLEDGFMLSGERGGSATDAGGEVVFNTCMSGYQEVLSDPSYAGQLVARARSVPSLEEQDLVKEVSGAFVDVDEPIDPAIAHDVSRQWPGVRLVLVDFGVKRNILRSLRSRGLTVDVVPYDASVEAILSRKPDGVVLSNGPGDPARLQPAVAVTRALIGRVPLLGICQGHQLIGQAAGARTRRLRFGHHGGNHPVMDVRSGKVTITSQNHEFEVEPAGLSEAEGFYVSHRNLHDGSVEGLSHRSLPVRSVQFHPEGAPGPQDNQGIFDEFLDLLPSTASIARVTGAPGRRPTRVARDVPNPRLRRHEQTAVPRSVLVIGSGPIVIGQAAEFDYAGTQACKALREEGVRTILVNSNPATIMTDEGVADRIYIEH